MKRPAAGDWTCGALGCVLVLVLLVFPSAAVESAYPVERAKQALSRSVWSRVKGFFSGAAAGAENARLKRELAAREMLVTDLARVEAENARLRAALGYVTRTSGAWLAAGVLSSGGGAAGAHETIRVDKGTRAGVKLGAVVSVPEGLVGRVTAVTPQTAEVTLVTDPALRVSCLIETGLPNPPHGILSGGSDELVLRHLVRTNGVSRYARVVTSGLGGVYPRGLAVGTYLGGDKVRPAVSFATLEDVFIRREE